MEKLLNENSLWLLFKQCFKRKRMRHFEKSEVKQFVLETCTLLLLLLVIFFFPFCNCRKGEKNVANHFSRTEGENDDSRWFLKLKACCLAQFCTDCLCLCVCALVNANMQCNAFTKRFLCIQWIPFTEMYSVCFCG